MPYGREFDFPQGPKPFVTMARATRLKRLLKKYSKGVPRGPKSTQGVKNKRLGGTTEVVP